MKYLNILCNNFELHCLFPDGKLIEMDNVAKNINKLKIQSKENTIEITHYIENIYEKLNDLENIFDADSYYVNPPNDLVIVCDRQLCYRFYFPLLKNHKELFNKLEDLYVERNFQIFY